MKSIDTSAGDPRCKPIVKWAGGKSRLLPELREQLPKKIGTYVEPFSGGAALFFALASEKGPRGRRFERAILVDRNEDLIACYRAVRDQVEQVIDALAAYRYEPEMYYATRDLDPSAMSDVERGARFLFLNRTCYNGLWRVNSRGRFNVPFGRYKNPRIVRKEELRAASIALQATELAVGDFMAGTQSLGKGDFVYFDPPYVPVSNTADFTAYASGGFSQDDQERLVAELRRLRKAGAKAMLSNADTAETRALYREFSVSVVTCSRSINSDPDKRGDTTELIVTSWGPAALREAPVVPFRVS
jgi:DNA adenine methylase